MREGGIKNYFIKQSFNYFHLKLSLYSPSFETTTTTKTSAPLIAKQILKNLFKVDERTDKPASVISMITIIRYIKTTSSWIKSFLLMVL